MNIKMEEAMLFANYVKANNCVVGTKDFTDIISI